MVRRPPARHPRETRVSRGSGLKWLSHFENVSSPPGKKPTQYDVVSTGHGQALRKGTRLLSSFSLAPADCVGQTIAFSSNDDNITAVKVTIFTRPQIGFWNCKTRLRETLPALLIGGTTIGSGPHPVHVLPKSRVPILLEPAEPSSCRPEKHASR